MLVEFVWVHVACSRRSIQRSSQCWLLMCWECRRNKVVHAYRAVADVVHTLQWCVHVRIVVMCCSPIVYIQPAFVHSLIKSTPSACSVRAHYAQHTHTYIHWERTLVWRTTTSRLLRATRSHKVATAGVSQLLSCEGPSGGAFQLCYCACTNVIGLSVSSLLAIYPAARSMCPSHGTVGRSDYIVDVYYSMQLILITHIHLATLTDACRHNNNRYSLNTLHSLQYRQAIISVRETTGTVFFIAQRH